MVSYPSFSFPSTNTQPNSAFGPARVDLSRIGQIYGNYLDSQEAAAKRQNEADDRAYVQSERNRASQGRQAIADAFKPGQTPNFEVLAATIAPYDPEMATGFMKMGSQEADRRHSRAFDERKFALDEEYKRAQMEKLKREAADAGTTYGKSGTVFQDASGRAYTVQFGADGSRVILPVETPGQIPPAPSQPVGDTGVGRFASPGLTGETAPAERNIPLTPMRGVSVVGDMMYDNATGAAVRSVGGNISEGERQKVLGREAGEGQAALPKAKRALESYEVKSTAVSNMIEDALGQAGPWTTGFRGNLLSFMSGTPAHDLSKTLTGIKANLGFETLQDMRDNSPTGGALGQVSEMELELLQSAWGSVEQSQSEAQLRRGLERIRQIKKQFVEMKRRAYEEDAARFGAANVPKPDAANTSASDADDGWTNVGGLRIREKR